MSNYNKQMILKWCYVHGNKYMLGKFQGTIKYGQTRNTSNIGHKTNYLRIQISFKYWTLLSLECNNKTKHTKKNRNKK